MTASTVRPAVGGATTAPPGLSAPSRTTQLRLMLALRRRTGWRGLVGWVLGVALSVLGTAAAVSAVYDTPEEIHTYAVSVTAGNALLAINGKVEGIESLGGIVQDEFGFIASFLLPLSGIALVAAGTRREEESGRLELLLSGQISRVVPVAAALLTALVAILTTGLLSAGALVLTGIPATGAVAYALSLAALAWVFAGLAGLAAQLVGQTRTVYAVGLSVLLAGYVLRGVGDVTGNPVTWLSPLGWAERSAPFGGTRWWVLAIPALTGALAAGAALGLAAGRDLGAGALRIVLRRHRPVRLRGGRAALDRLTYRPVLLGWLAGSLVLAGMLGLLAQQILDAVAGTPALGEALGAVDSAGPDQIAALAQLYLGLLAAGFLVHAVTALRAEETGGRLEQVLAGGVSRSRWLAGQLLTITAAGALLVATTSCLLAATVAWSTGTSVDLGGALGAGAAYLLAGGVPAAVGLVLVARWPRLVMLVWAGYAVIVFIATLGPGLGLPGLVLDLAPVTHLASPPAGTPPVAALLGLSGVVLGLVGVAWWAFRRRDLPVG